MIHTKKEMRWQRCLGDYFPPGGRWHLRHLKKEKLVHLEVNLALSAENGCANVL